MNTFFGAETDEKWMKIKLKFWRDNNTGPESYFEFAKYSPLQLGKGKNKETKFEIFFWSFRDFLKSKIDRQMAWVSPNMNILVRYGNDLLQFIFPRILKIWHAWAAINMNEMIYDCCHWFTVHRNLKSNSHIRFCNRHLNLQNIILDHGESKKSCLNSCRNRNFK